MLSGRAASILAYPDHHGAPASCAPKNITVKGRCPQTGLVQSSGSKEKQTSCQLSNQALLCKLKGPKMKRLDVNLHCFPGCAPAPKGHHLHLEHPTPRRNGRCRAYPDPTWHGPSASRILLLDPESASKLPTFSVVLLSIQVTAFLRTKSRYLRTWPKQAEQRLRSHQIIPDGLTFLELHGCLRP